MMQSTLSAGAVPFRYKNQKVEFLLLRAFKYWDFPKGTVGRNEDPFEAALRELKEETGLEPAAHPYGKVFFETKPYGKGKVARYYIAEISADAQEVVFLPNPESGIIEHHEYRWVEYEGARNLLVPRVQEVLDWANSFLKK